jgi:hypothetical protein
VAEPSQEPEEKKPVSPLWGLDLRSLAVCRMLTGAILVWDLANRALEIRLHYTDQGILPIKSLLEFDCLFPSIYLIASSVPEVAALMVIHGLFGLALIAGYRTSAVTVICWYLTRSLHARNFAVLNGGDVVFISLLFWAMFVPWGQRWSLDALRRGPEPGKSELHRSLAGVLLALQLPFIYWMSLFHKLEPTWLAGDAVYFALHSHLYARQAGEVFLQFPAALKALTKLTFVWELLGPALLLVRWPRIRGLTCLAFAFMHLGFGICLKIGIFTVTPMLYLVALSPGGFWERLLRPLLGPLARGLTGPVSRLPRPPDFRVGPEWNPVLVFMAFFCFFFAVGQDSRLLPMVPKSLSWVERWTGMQQRWSVFVNLPSLNDGWMVMEGRRADGSTVDIFQGNDPVDWDAPPNHLHSKIHSHYRWPTPLVVILVSANMQAHFTRALVDDWNRQHPDRPVVEANLYFVKSTVLPDFRERTSEKQFLHRWTATP